ncbi:MAG: CHASE2 domain-containing protein [Bdellovibrionaceae bacterium]|jgi:signal transduction histidine kinase|nr:CHASE2 domain-containing protein [Pseudobdellovibrionaceae bacterium]
MYIQNVFNFLKNNINYGRVMRVGFAIVISIIISKLNLDFVEGWTYNARVSLQTPQKISDKIKLISIKQKQTPLLKDLLETLEAIKKQKPDHFVYLADLELLKGNREEKSQFVNFFNENPNFHISTVPQKKTAQKMGHPFNKLRTRELHATSDKYSFAKDNVTRRLILTAFNKENIIQTIASNYTNKSAKSYSGAYKYYDSIQLYFKYLPPKSFSSIAFSDLLSAPEISDLSNKIIFMGADNEYSSTDYIKSPYSKSRTEYTFLELQATLLNTLLSDSGISRSSPWVNNISIFVVALITVFSVFTLKPITGLYILFATFFTFSSVGYLAFNFFGYWIDMAHSFLAIFLCYYFFIPYRLIKENKKSFEYQEHNKMLSKVEELKTNFMRMMSHDLKTPLARIQGLTDVVTSTSDNLLPQQKDALKSISKSSFELTVFIETILDLSRVESNEVKLQLHSKDINAVLTQVIKKCEFLAKEKNISIITEFEPMFSIKVDESLLKQVFTNLIENAIKYSPADSRILVSSEEFNNQMIIQVADQGKGIDEEEQCHIFDKFFRSRDAKNSTTAGSGLGLYLSKYFVELHKGSIQVDSDENKGSTFTVNLPMNL